MDAACAAFREEFILNVRKIREDEERVCYLNSLSLNGGHKKSGMEWRQGKIDSYWRLFTFHFLTSSGQAGAGVLARHHAGDCGLGGLPRPGPLRMAQGNI